MNIHKNYSSSISLPDLIQMNSNLYAAAFPLMKLLPAKHVIEKALENGIIKRGSTVVETSSGTYALGMAIICAELGLKAHIVTDPVLDRNLQNQLEHLGCEVEIVEDPINGHQVARLKAVQKYLEANPDSFWPQQYDNPDHLEGYNGFADQLIQELGEEFILVASVGSGSSSCGTIKHLRKTNPNIQLVGVDTFGSILFGLKNSNRALRGLGNSIIPKNLRHEYFDQIHWISAHFAFEKTIELYKQSALFAGPTSGACYQIARWVAEQNPKKKVVFISADMGYRYASTLYTPSWLNDMKEPIVPVEIPQIINELEEANQTNVSWAYMNWNRRALEGMS